MTRHESRTISRKRTRIQALNPCQAFSHNGGHNPFDYLFQKFFMQSEATPEEKKRRHELKMAVEKREAKARQSRKRNKV